MTFFVLFCFIGQTTGWEDLAWLKVCAQMLLITAPLKGVPLYLQADQNGLPPTGSLEVICLCDADCEISQIKFIILETQIVRTQKDKVQNHETKILDNMLCICLVPWDLTRWSSWLKSALNEE